MVRRLSSDARDSLVLVSIAALVAAVMFGARYLPLPAHDHPLWKNIYLTFTEASSDTQGLWWFVIAVGWVNSGWGLHIRFWRSSLPLLAGLAGLVGLVSCAPGLIPHFELYSALAASAGGMVAAAALRDRVPGRVVRDLFARDVDHAHRFFPVAGLLISLVLLGVWVWDLGRRWAAHDYTSVTDVACFAWGATCLLIAGRRPGVLPPSTVSAGAQGI